ncbi:putative nucleoporin [Helianthus anomalus]
MQIFEYYKMSAGACHFAVAALEQVGEVLGLDESPITTKGRVWLISNPDEESKYICLRRFIIVLYEHGAIKVTSSLSLCLLFSQQFVSSHVHKTSTNLYFRLFVVDTL